MTNQTCTWVQFLQRNPFMLKPYPIRDITDVEPLTQLNPTPTHRPTDIAIENSVFLC